MQLQEASLEQQQLVMQQMEAARIAFEAAQRQHIEALRQLEENRAAGPSQAPQAQPQEWSLEDFLVHQLSKFDGKTSPDQVDQWIKDIERIFDAKRCPDESRLAYIVYMLTEEAEHCWASMKYVMEEKREQIT